MKIQSLLKKLLLLSLMFFNCGSITIKDLSFEERHQIEVLANEAESTEETKENDFELVTVDLGADGDCTIISHNNIDIMVDCGGNYASGKNIINKLNGICSDHVLDYLIISHGDSDHLCNFAKRNDDPNTLESWVSEDGYEITTLIDFEVKDDKTINNFPYKNNLYSSNDYHDYTSAKQRLISNGKIKNYFSASECLYKARGLNPDDLIKRNSKTDNEKQFFSSLPKLDLDSSKGFKLEILNNPYCYQPLPWDDLTNHTPNSIDRNILSVCVLIHFDGQKFLFTGDLPEFNSANGYTRKGAFGETTLVKNNLEALSDGVLFFKAAHHGSKTSNSDVLLSVIRPQYISISCNGFGSYDFPSQNSLTLFGQYTSNVFMTDISENGKSAPLNGNITYGYSTKSRELDVDCSNKVEGEKDSIFFKSKILKGRMMPIVVNELTNPSSMEMNNCTYLKSGSLDVLINDGGTDLYGKDAYIINKKIDILCNDHILDFLVISNQLPSCNSYLFGINGLFSSGKYHIKTIRHLIVHPWMAGETNQVLLNNLGGLIDSGIVQNYTGIRIKENSSNKTEKYCFSNSVSKENEDKGIDDLTAIYGLSSAKRNDKNDYFGTLTVLPSSCNKKNAVAENCGTSLYSLPILVTIKSFSYLNLGICTRFGRNGNDVFEANSDLKCKVNALTVPDGGYFYTVEDEVNKANCKLHTRYYENVISNTHNTLLFNCPFGSMSKSLNLYPSIYWSLNTEMMNSRKKAQYSSDDSSSDDVELNFVATTKKVQSKNRRYIDLENSNGDTAALYLIGTGKMRNHIRRNVSKNSNYYSLYENMTFDTEESIERMTDYMRDNAYSSTDKDANGNTLLSLL